MATRSASRHRSIPINVVVERRPRVASPTKPVPTPPVAPAAVNKPEWSIEHRRRIMWIVVGVGSLAIIIGWVSLFSAQIRGNSPTFFGDIAQMIRDARWPWEKKPATANEKEIRQLEEQVFPQFQ